MHALMIVDIIFNEILKVDIKMAMSMELEILVEVIGLRCVLTQDVERMLYALCLIVLGILGMGKRELIALLNLSSWCLVMVEQLFLTVPRGCLQFVIVVFPDHTHLLFLVDESTRNDIQIQKYQQLELAKYRSRSLV